jgi:hypothetical protein
MGMTEFSPVGCDFDGMGTTEFPPAARAGNVCIFCGAPAVIAGSEDAKALRVALATTGALLGASISR